MNKYKHIFFDLDHTLWDTNRNSAESLSEIYTELNLAAKGINSLDSLLKSYHSHNERVWGLWAENKIGPDALRINRFVHTLNDFGIDDIELAEQMSRLFLARTPYKKHILPGAVDVLKYLKGKYTLSIITNGFKESQIIKLRESGIHTYFEQIIISEEVGFNKPDPAIFFHAMSAEKLSCKQCLMVGDSFEADIAGAHAAGIDQVHLNPQNIAVAFEPTHTISRLDELMEIL